MKKFVLHGRKKVLLYNSMKIYTAVRQEGYDGEITDIKSFSDAAKANRYSELYQCCITENELDEPFDDLGGLNLFTVSITLLENAHEMGSVSVYPESMRGYKPTIKFSTRSGTIYFFILADTEINATRIDRSW
jgi:hypothetical protein